MYSEKDLLEIKDQIKKMILVAIVVFTAFLALSIVLSVVVSNTFGMIVLVIGVCLDIFIWGMYGTPVLAYYRFINDMVNGRSRKIRGVIRNVGQEAVYKDNKLFYYELLIEEDGVERMLLLDDHKKWPELFEGNEYEFEIHENFVKNVLNAG